MENETCWDKIREEIREATAGIDPEDLVINVETIQNIKGQKTIQVMIYQT